MAGVKKQDKPAQPAIDGGKIETVVNGVSVMIDMRDLDSVDVLYQLRDAQKGDLFAAIDLIDVLIGESQRQALVDTIRDPETKRASVADFTGLLEQLLHAVPKS